jgi:hypothetical protein
VQAKAESPWPIYRLFQAEVVLFRVACIARMTQGAGNYTLAAILNANATSYIDSGATIGGNLPATTTNLRGRFDASLVVDPGTVVKLQGSRIEVGIGVK